MKTELPTWVTRVVMGPTETGAHQKSQAGSVCGRQRGKHSGQEMSLTRGEVVADTLSSRSAGAEVTQGWRESLEDVQLKVTAQNE